MEDFPKKRRALHKSAVSKNVHPFRHPPLPVYARPADLPQATAGKAVFWLAQGSFQKHSADPLRA